MATQLYRVPTNNALQYTLDSQIAAGATSLTLNQSVAGIVRGPGVLIIDRVDSSGNTTPTKREYFTFTTVSSAVVSGLVGGLAGSTQQVHSAGAIVEFIPDVIWADSLYSVITAEHDTYGTHISLASINTLSTNTAIIASAASINQGTFKTLINASGASLQGVSPTIPVWVFSGTLSGASTALGKPLDMPRSGTINWISAITRAGSSGASLFLDITKNGTSIITATASTSLLNIPVNGTYVSLGSIATQTFVSGDVFNFSVLNSGSMAQDLTIKFHAR